jgi:hypothetical protein
MMIGISGKVDRHIVDWYWVAILQPDTAAAPHACANAAVSGVKDDWKLRFGENLVQRIPDAIVREELLNRWMKLEAAYCPRADQTSRFAHGFGAARRVDARKRDCDVGVLLANSTTSSFESRGVPVSVSSTVKMSHAMLRER